MATIKSYTDSLQEEPVSEGLEEAAKYHRAHGLYGGDINLAMEDSFRLGAIWKEEQMMAKAIDAEVKVDAGGYPYIPQIELWDYDKDMPLAKEGDKYKVILIKED